MEKQEEVWRDVPGYEGRYQVSNFGRVKSLNYNKTNKERILKPIVNAVGYYQVTFSKEGKLKAHTIHRLVANAFVPGWFEGAVVNHKDENKLNNFPSNLEWCSIGYNVTYGNAIAKSTATKVRPVLQFSLNGELIDIWESTRQLERKKGYNEGNIGKCCNGKCKTAYGYKWMREKDIYPFVLRCLKNQHLYLSLVRSCVSDLSLSTL